MSTENEGRMCPGCDVKQFGEFAKSLKDHFTVVCRACSDYEHVKVFKRKERLTGVGRKG